MQPQPFGFGPTSEFWDGERREGRRHRTLIMWCLPLSFIVSNVVTWFLLEAAEAKGPARIPLTGILVLGLSQLLLGLSEMIFRRTLFGTGHAKADSP